MHQTDDCWLLCLLIFQTSRHSIHALRTQVDRRRDQKIPFTDQQLFLPRRPRWSNSHRSEDGSKAGVAFGSLSRTTSPIHNSWQHGSTQDTGNRSNDTQARHKKKKKSELAVSKLQPRKNNLNNLMPTAEMFETKVIFNPTHHMSTPILIGGFVPCTWDFK